MTESASAEPIIDPGLPIVDAHHHLWFLPEAALASMEAQTNIVDRAFAPNCRSRARYLFDEFMADLRTGHNIRATVFVDAHAMYRAHGPEAMKSVGEVEFATGVAAIADSSLFGDVRLCAGIVGGVDLRLGDAVADILDAHLQAGGTRYRGVRSRPIAHDDDNTIMGATAPHVLLDSKFRAGFKLLKRFGLSFDVFLLDPQLPELIDLAHSFPETQIVLNHVGAPLGVGRYAGKREERFALWRNRIRTLSQCANVAVKLGGLGLPFAGFNSYMSTPPATVEQLSLEWSPYIESCIAAFGADRCMFESNFPMDAATCTYAVLWNAFKHIVRGASQVEKTALFSGTAKRIYRLDI